ncbi:hypothetical protein [Pseudoxanthomonas sacheonensis]|uniref:hypothetical protein n=1 Tax=Pseudoxanthomonas sacheonensis TaxID=443615 RepID=UPI0013D63E59|nr:hypothetical protein [Pseudoxanthomonas sacheonensis]
MNAMTKAMKFIALSGAMCLLAIPVDAACDDVLAIGPVRVGMKKEEVVRSLNSPRAVKNSSGFIQKIYSYDRLVVAFDEDMRVAGVESSNPRYCLDGWLCPGGDFRAASRKAKTASATVSTNKITVHGDGCWAVATAKLGLVNAVIIKCEP